MTFTDNRQERRERAMLEPLRAMIRAEQQARFGSAEGLQPFALDLRLEVDPHADWSVSFVDSLGEQLARQLATLQAQRDSYVPGRVYCYACRSSHCEHAMPSSTLDVFTGYSESGRPIWHQFHQALLDLGHQEVHQLYSDRPNSIAVVMDGESLHARTLVGNGKHSQTFVVLSQILMGYFRLRGSTGELEKLALTIQCVASRDHLNQLENHINVLVEPEHRILVSEQLPWLSESIRLAATQTRTARADANAIVRKLASDLVRQQKRTLRTTKHAQHRRPQRPIEKALSDVASANSERVFYDVKSDAFAVRGKSGRCHIFNQQGRHVTSFSIEFDAVQSRLRRKRWRPVTDQQFQTLRAQIAEVNPITK